MTETDAAPPVGPYATAASIYWAAGWRGTLPLPPRQKAPVPNGWTGARGEWPSRADVQAWIEEQPSANLALRLPPGVIGIDVDHYDAKPGGLVFHQLEQNLGALPATWRTTSRDDGVSGIRLYRIPEGLRWPGGLGPGIDTIRVDHRYAVAWPSVHPNGGTYRWITPDGATALGVVPDVEALPDLPDAWVAHFTRGELSADQPHANLTDAAATQWLGERGQGAPCRHMQTALQRAETDLTVATSRHDATLSSTNRLVWLAGEGHSGAVTALQQLRAAFLKAMAGDRGDGVEGEWDRMVSGAVRIAAAAHPDINPDPCDDPFHGLIPKETASSSAPSSAPSAATTGSSPATSALTTPSTVVDAESDTPSTETDLDQYRTTWWPRPLGNVLDGTAVEPPPEHLHRTDGLALLYSGKINGIIGPSESGKTWAALAACVQAVHEGHRVTILDFEDTDASVTNRLLLLGLTRQQVSEQVAYIGPDEAMHAVARSDLEEHLDTWAPAIVVLDGFNAAMTLHNFDLMSNKDATSFFQLVLKHLKKNGAAVVYVDHTPKDKANESSGGIGAQAKRAMTDGTILRASIVKEFGKGQKGTVRLFVDKDRHGHVRGGSSPFKVGERSLHWAADMTLTPTPHDSLEVQLVDPQAVAEGRASFRPTINMERLCAWISENPGLGRNEILRACGIKKENANTALRVLVTEGWVAVGKDGQKHPHTVVETYSEAADLAGIKPPNHRGPTGVPPGSGTPPQQPGSPGSHRVDEVYRVPGVRLGAEESKQGPHSEGPRSARIVERTVAGNRFLVNLDTGDMEPA